MGGSGGGRSISADELRTLIDIAKKELKKGDTGTKRNIFISFVEEDLQEVNLFRGQAKNDNNDLEFNDWSVKKPYDSTDANYIKRKIREKINQSSKTVVYVTDKTHSSKWVNWEISESIRLGKQVVAVYQGESCPSKLPNAITDNSIKCLKWDHGELAKELAK